MNWTNNLISYCDSGRVGKCPACNSENVKVNEHIHGKRKSLTFTCADCKSSDHFDGMTTKE
jgi:transposase-like protein